jgi:CHAT domain-containing protein
MRVTLAAALLGLGACSAAPPTGSVASIALGNDGSGLACSQQTQPDGQVLIYCGDLPQPSGRIVIEPVAAGTQPAHLVQRSPWRTTLDLRFDCREHGSEPLFDSQTATLDCVRRMSGWPRIALVTVLDGEAYFGDADPAAALVLRRGIGVLSGRIAASAAQVPVNEGLAARRAAAEAVSSRDIRQYDVLMMAGVRANLTENFAAAEAAFRQAAELQLRYQGPDAPTRADPLLHQALQLSNLGRYAESDAVFATATHLIDAARSRGSLLPDETLVARLALYRGLSLLNQNRPTDAMTLFDQAERGYTIFAPQGSRLRPAGATAPRGLEAAVAGLAEAQLFQDPVTASAVLGLISTKRSRAVALLRLGRVQESQVASQTAQDLAQVHGLALVPLEARILRTSAMVAEAQGDQPRALSLLTRSVNAFNEAFPSSRPVAETELLRAASLFRQERAGDGLMVCRQAVALLQRLRGGVAVHLMMPCLDGLAEAADRAGESELGWSLRAEMFTASQLAQSNLTSTQIAEAAARLSEGQRDTRVGQAIRQRDIVASTLEKLYRDRDAAEQAQRSGAPSPGRSVADLNRAIEQAEAAETEAEAALGAASPNYRQLVESVATAQEVFSALHPREALATMVLGEDHGWTLVLRDGKIATMRIAGGRPRMQWLVSRVRASMHPGGDGLPPRFDTDAASELYAALLGPASGRVSDLRSLVVAPSGPLLSIPFGLLLTGPANGDLAQAPWLVRSTTVAHVPAPANFVSLRRSGGSRAGKPWAGFGDPVPVTLRQALALFPSPDCRGSADLLSHLPALAGARSEIELVRRELGGSAADELEGSAFTRSGLERLGLRDFRVLHFATHGLLPTDLSCQSEPALLLSAPPGASSAAQALLTASQIAQWDLDADTVILSACNTSGPDGQPAGESLSGLARSFFFAGTRSLLVTHWDVNDRVTAVLVAGTMQRLRAAPEQGLAAALAGQQRALLAQATGSLEGLAHPFYWAPLALVGEGGGSGASGRGAHAGP